MPSEHTSKLTELHGSNGSKPQQRAFQAQRLPQTALFAGPGARRKGRPEVDADPEIQTPVERPQLLPRADPPTASFSAARPTLIGLAVPQSARKRDDDFQADAVWAEMQKTLADVEVSAMKSSHIFSSSHAGALEELRAAQLGLAQAWAASEKEELADEEFANEQPETQAIGTVKHETRNSPINGKGKTRQGSSSSASGQRLEEETKRDIQLARRRREANDRYFKQVSRSVIDVVSKLDEVVNAMRRVEGESREIWNESSDSDIPDDLSETDHSAHTATQDSDALTDSPASIKK